MNDRDYFWNASVEELKQGFFFNKKAKGYTCLICGKTFEAGVVYPAGEMYYTAEKAVEMHIEKAHGSVFEYFLNMGKAYTGLTEHQKKLMMMFYQGLTDKEIVEKTQATSTSTIRNQRFAFKEKYKQAKIIVAMTELLEERKENSKINTQNTNRSQREDLVDIHRTATMIDERYAITEAEKAEVLARYFDKDNRLIVKEFPAREKKKIILLQHISNEFESNKIYTEKEINAIIKKYYDDIATIRRYLIEYGFLDRRSDGTAYWVKQ